MAGNKESVLSIALYAYNEKSQSNVFNREEWPMPDSDAVAISQASAEAVAEAMNVIKRRMPEASEPRRLMMIMANAAASCGMLGIQRDDVLTLVAGAYENGSAKGPVRSLFE